MFRNYVKIIVRTLRRQKVFSAINILGLAIGLATCFIILLYVTNELSYDRFHAKGDRIVRVTFHALIQDQKIEEADVMSPVAQALQTNYPEVEATTRIRDIGTPRLEVGNEKFENNRFAFADSNFFEVFSFPLVAGDVRRVLQQPHTAVISAGLATKLFGKGDAVGKVFTLKGDGTPWQVTGVMRDMPLRSHLQYDVLGSMASVPEARGTTWMASGFYTYAVLPKGYDPHKLEARLPQMTEKYMSDQLKQAFGLDYKSFLAKGNQIGFSLQPLTSIHLHSHLSGELQPGGDVRTIYIFSAIALFMLLIACINFMNLSTAGASKRAREVGVRKVLGSERRQLRWQFLLESVSLTFVALVLAVVLVRLVLPWFNSYMDLHVELPVRLWVLGGVLVLTGLVVGVLAGSYPAFYLSSFRPVSVLKGKFSTNRQSRYLRSALVVFQFFISIGLMVSTFVVYRQLRYIQHKELGFDKNQLLVLPGNEALGPNKEVFRQQLLQDPRVADVAVSHYLPAGPSYGNNFTVYADGKSTQWIKTLRYEVDDHYVPVMGMKVVQGRNFSKDYGSDSTGIVLNEAAVKAFGLGNHPLDHLITTNVDEKGKSVSYHVIGIVHDFHFRSLHELISPLVMTLGSGDGEYIVKMKTADVKGLRESIGGKWQKLAPDVPFNYSFMDDRFNHMYTAELKTGTLLAIFSCLTIFVACLGLFGLALFTAEQRTKEISIRKVLGASVNSIIGLLSKDFLRLVVVANLFAWPLAGWFMHRWLQDFAYRIHLQWWYYAVAGLAALLIALGTISLQAIKVATRNPVKSLRSE